MKTIWGISFFTSLLTLFLTYGSLPDLVATHYSINGEPNDWMQRPLYLGVMVFVLLIVNGLNATLSLIMKKIGFQWINVPYKEIWVAKTECHEELIRRVRHFLAVCSVFVNLLLTYIQYGILQYHQTKAHYFNFLFLITVLVGVILLVGYAFTYFKPPSDVRN